LRVRKAHLVHRAPAEHHIELREPEDERVGAVDERDVDVAAELVCEPAGELEPPEAGAEDQDRRRHDGQGYGARRREREHGRLRYSPRDLAIARLTRRLIDLGVGVEGVRMLKDLVQGEIQRAAAANDDRTLTEAALRILYERKAFEEATGMKEEHYPEGHPPPPGPPGRKPGPKHG